MGHVVRRAHRLHRNCRQVTPFLKLLNNIVTGDPEFGADFRVGDKITPKGYCYTMMIEPNERGLNLVRLPEQLELRLSRLAIVGILVGMQLQRQFPVGNKRKRVEAASANFL